MSEESLVSKRSEIVFIYDAILSNLNGDPQTSNDMPRIDEQTDVAYSTDVRLKRYIRDEMYDNYDNLDIFVKNPSKDDSQTVTRDQRFEKFLEEEGKDIEEMDREEFMDELLDYYADVRYFGSVFSFEEDDYRDMVPSKRGPLQFEIGSTMHPVRLNRETNSQTCVFGSKEENNQGTFTEDNRVKYGMLQYHGLIDENAADSTHLTQEDVERLDRLMWRSLKNQTITRSKMGHEPRFYVRVEYEKDMFHIGNLNLTLDFRTEKEDVSEVRTIKDVYLNVDEFLKVLEDASEMIEEVNVKSNRYLEFEQDGEMVGFDSVKSEMEDRLGKGKVNEINVYQK